MTDQSNTLTPITRRCPTGVAVGEAVQIVKTLSCGFCVIRWDEDMYVHVMAHNVCCKKKKKVYRAVRFKLGTRSSVESTCRVYSTCSMAKRRSNTRLDPQHTMPGIEKSRAVFTPPEGTTP